MYDIPEVLLIFQLTVAGGPDSKHAAALPSLMLKTRKPGTAGCIWVDPTCLSQAPYLEHRGWQSGASSASVLTAWYYGADWDDERDISANGVGMPMRARRTSSLIGETD